MLDFFTIFTRGGVVLWCIKYTEVLFGPALNALIQSVILEEKTASKSFNYQDLCLEYRLDNQFELIFVVAYQKNLRLSYTDKFLDQINLEFRDRYKNRLDDQDLYKSSFDFDFRFKSVLQTCEKLYKIQEAAPRVMKTFEQSEKSKKSISSMIISKKNDPNFNKKELKKQEAKKKQVVEEATKIENGENGEIGEKSKESESVGVVAEDVLQFNREKFIQKMTKKTEKLKNSKPKAINNVKKNIKQPRKWDLGGNASDAALLERKIEDDNTSPKTLNARLNTEMIGQMKGNIKLMDEEENNDMDMSDEEESDGEEEGEVKEQELVKEKLKSKKTNGFFMSLKSLVGSKELTDKDLEPVLSKFCDHLVAKNVAIEVAQRLCDSLKEQLCGKTLGTFDTVRSTVKKSLHDALLQILSPKKRVDILRDCLKKKAEKKPYVITFCGVNGVGKSTNLAKIAFWLIENNLRILIAACDTFRSGAVEQLKTHVCHLNALYAKANVPVVELYQKGYGKDAAKIAFEAVKYASVSNFDVVLIDTAGRMHNKEHLMRDLANLIKLNEPDLVLFVGEALVGNVAVTQLIKFNEAIVDYAADSQNPKTIDGILLTKFDTVDDKVGAAISMTYISGQPIMFVGTGQNYTDLKALNPNVVVNALMK